jgi:OpgC protein
LYFWSAAREFEDHDLLLHPDLTLAQSLLLEFQPTHLAVLALYVVLLLAVRSDPVAAAPQPGARVGGIGDALRLVATAQLEPPRLPGRDLATRSAGMVTIRFLLELKRAWRGLNV